MLLEPMSKLTRVELIISEAGSVVLLHEGPLQHNYLWVQYDQSLRTMMFITDDEGLQNLGMTIHEAFHKNLQNTQELIIITVNKDKSWNDPLVVKFMGDIITDN